MSEGHRFPPPKGSLTDVGGDFFTFKQYISSKHDHKRVLKQYVPGSGSFAQDRVQTGPVVAHLPTDGSPALNPVWPPSGASSNSALDKKGATAVALCKPTNSVANLTTALGELMREGLPKLVGSASWESRTNTALRKSAGDEYLNLQFGWAPLVNDVVSFGNGVVNADAVLRQYERDAGKVVRRKFHFSTEKSSSVTLLDNSAPQGTGQLSYDTLGALQRTRETVRHTYFSGAFTYHLPTGYDSRSKLSRYALLAQLLGLDMKPSTLWNLAPWSWAVDWVTNTSDVISNLEDFATLGLVMRYGYIMEHTIVSDTYTLGPCRLKDGPWVQADPITFVTETKVRRKANPFGFGVTWEGLSTFQTSILAALGMSRSR